MKASQDPLNDFQLVAPDCSVSATAASPLALTHRSLWSEACVSMPPPSLFLTGSQAQALS